MKFGSQLLDEIKTRIKVSDIVWQLKEGGIDAIIVTAPYKKYFIPHLGKINPRAESIGSINCIHGCDGELVGNNTDWFGFGKALESFSDFESVIIIGAGVSYSVDATGGQKDASVISHTHNLNHNHTYGTSTSAAGAHTHTHSRLNSTSSYTRGVPVGSGGAAGSSFGTQTTSSAGSHAHTFNGTTAAYNGASQGASGGVSGTNRNLAPYYALCYIMKT